MKLIIPKLAIVLSILVSFQFINAQEIPKAELFDSFSYSNSEDGSARIDMLRNALNQVPTNSGYIIVYGGKVSKRGEIEAHLRGIKQAFTLKGIDHQRIPTINGGYRQKITIEFWIVPQGADLPKPTPTIDAKRIRLKGISKKIIPYECCF